jgi:hypothetical protein
MRAGSHPVQLEQAAAGRPEQQLTFVGRHLTPEMCRGKIKDIFVAIMDARDLFSAVFIGLGQRAFLV